MGLVIVAGSIEMTSHSVTPVSPKPSAMRRVLSRMETAFRSLCGTSALQNDLATLAAHLHRIEKIVESIDNSLSIVENNQITIRGDIGLVQNKIDDTSVYIALKINNAHEGVHLLHLKTDEMYRSIHENIKILLEQGTDPNYLSSEVDRLDSYLNYHSELIREELRALGIGHKTRA